MIANGSTFSDKVYQFLLKEKAENKLQSFIIDIEKSQKLVVSLYNGFAHSKGPLHEDESVDCSATIIFKDGEGGAINLRGAEFETFLQYYKNCQKAAFPVPFLSLPNIKHENYPEIKLCDPELLKLWKQKKELQSKILGMIQSFDGLAKTIKHPSLMGREVNIEIERSEKLFFDANENLAREESCSCTLSCSFSLKETSEYGSEIYGRLPTIKEISEVVSDAAKNIVPIENKALDKKGKYVVVLSPRALTSLVEDLVIPNCEIRSLLENSGAWSILHVGKKVISNISISDDPCVSYSPFSSCFDAEGTPTQSVTLIDKGVLKHPLLTFSLLEEVQHRFPQSVNGLKLTGHATSALQADHSNIFIKIDGQKFPDLESLLKTCDKAVVVPWLTGMSVDPLTGQFSLDSEGAQVFQNGKLVHSCSVTLCGNFFEALSKEGGKIGPEERNFNVTASYWATENLTLVPKERT